MKKLFASTLAGFMVLVWLRVLVVMTLKKQQQLLEN